MPGLTAALASLQDVLEVKGCAISEPELWSVLCLCAEALQDVLFKGNVLESEMPRVVATPDTVYMRPDGKITLDKLPLDVFVSSDFCAPEWKTGGGNVQTESSLEKLWIFSLGMTLYKAADHNRSDNEELDISPELHAVLSDMCEERADLRLTLTQIMQLSSSHAACHMIESFSIHVMRMYELVFGSADNISSLGQLTNPSSITSSPQASHDYDVRPAPVGKSATAEDAFSRPSSAKPVSPQQQRVRHSHINSHSQPNFSFAQTIEDSLRLSKLRVHHRSANIPQISQRQPFAAGNRLLQGPQRSMPALHIDYQVPARSQVAPVTTDTYLQHAYEKILQRRSLLAAIRHSLSNENVLDPLLFMNQAQLAHISDLQASANSLHYGSFHPDQFNQENRIPYGDSGVHASRPHSAYQVNRPESVQLLDRPKSAHPVLTQAADDTDVLLSDPVIKEAMQSSVEGHRWPATQSATKGGPTASQLSRNKRRPHSADTNKPINNKAVKGGPEFVRLAAKPIRKLKDFWPHKTSAKMTSVCVLIELLNGERLQLYCPSTTTGQQLFDVMLREIQLPEHYYFGLTHFMGGEHIFLDSLKKIEKYLPTVKRKSVTTKSAGGCSITVHQRVKYYARSVSMLRHEKTQHSLYLQLRRDIVEDRLRADDKDLINLAGVALQAEYGDYDIGKHHMNYFIVSYYFPQRLLKKVGKNRQVIVNKHAANSGLLSLEAEAKFIEGAMELYEYGIHFYSAYKAKKDPLSHTWVGVTSRGLALAETRGQQRVIVQRCSWDNIAKLSFNKEKFTIKPHSHTDDPTKIHRYTESYKKSKYLIWLSEEQHAFLVQSMTRGDYHQSAIAAGAIPEDMEYDMEEYEVDDELTGDVYDGEERDFDEAASYQFLQGAEVYNVDSEVVDGSRVVSAALPRRSSSRRREIEEEPVIEGVADQGLSPPDIEETLSDSLHARFDAIPSDSPEKHFTVVKLHRDPTSGIGIRLAGGGSSGIFIASLVRGGAAHSDGTMQVGDRIVAINGKSTEVISQSHAMELIKKSNNVVELIISQPATPLHGTSSYPTESEQESLSGYQSTDGSHTPPRAKTPNPMENERVRAALRAELEAEVAALKAHPQDTSDAMSLQYQQQLAKYNSKQRMQVQPAIQLSTPPQPSIASQPIQSRSTLRKELDDISSEERETPDNELRSPAITNIDDISTSESDVDEASALPLPTQKPVGTLQRSHLSSLSSTDAEGSENASKRLSAFASVSSPAKKAQAIVSDSKAHSSQANTQGSKATVPQNVVLSQATTVSAKACSSQAVTVNAKANNSQAKGELYGRAAVTSSPSVSSTLSEHESDMYNSLNVSHLAEDTGQWPAGVFTRDTESDSTLRSESASVDGDSTTPSRLMDGHTPTEGKSADVKRCTPLPQYDSDDTSEELSEMMSAPGTSQQSAAHSLLAGQDVSGHTEASPDKVKLKTPIDDHLQVGDNYQLTLHKINQSLGLNVTGGVNTSVRHGGIYVKSLLPRGAADMSARIRIGDRVISVNTIHLTSVTHKQAVETLRNASNPVTLVMERGELPATQTVSRGASSTLDLASPRSEEQGTPVIHHDGADNSTPSIEKLPVITEGECMEIELTKGTTGLGFSVCGRKGSSIDLRHSLLRVRKVFPRGSAAKSGKLLVGDILLRVNGNSLEGLTHNETVQVLRTSPALVKLFICRPDPRLMSPIPDTIAPSPIPAPTPDQLAAATGPSNQSRESTLSRTRSRDSTLTRSSAGTHTRRSPLVTPANQSSDATVTESSANVSQSQHTMQPPKSHSPIASLLAQMAIHSRASASEKEVRSDLNETRSTISAASTATYGTQESSTSKDTVQTALKSSSVQEFEASLKGRRGTDYSLPTPIRELDDMLQDNTSAHTSRSHSPQSLSRGSSINRSGRRLASEADIAVVNHRLADVALSQELGSDEMSSTESSTDDDSTTDVQSRHSTQEESSALPPAVDEDNRPKAVFSISSVSHSSSSASESSQANRIITVTLEKDSYGSLGFSVAGAASLGGCYIKKVIKDPALSDGTLQAGDKLYEVNGHDITRLSNPAAVALIKNQPSSVIIKVVRPIGTSDVPSKPPRTDHILREVAEAANELAEAESAPVDSVVSSISEQIEQIGSDSYTHDAIQTTTEVDYQTSGAMPRVTEATGAQHASIFTGAHVVADDSEVAAISESALITEEASVPVAGVTGALMVEGTGAPIVEGTGAPMVEGTGAPMAEGTGAPMVEGTGAPMVGGTGAPMVEGTGAPMAEGTGAPMVEGTGAPMVGGTGAPMVGGTGAPMVEGTGAPMVEGTDAFEADVKGSTMTDITDTHMTGETCVLTASVESVPTASVAGVPTASTKKELETTVARVDDNEMSEEDDFSSVEGDVPENLDDSWSSDTDSDELAEAYIPDSHIGTPTQSDLNSTLERTLDNEQLPESRIKTPSQEGSCEEDVEPPQAHSPVERPLSNASPKDSVSSWGDSVAPSDEDGNNDARGSLTPIDLTRGDSQRTATDDASGSPVVGLSRNASTHLSRHDSSHSNKSYLSTPVLSRNTSLKLPPTEEVYAVTLIKPSEGMTLGFSVLGIQAGGNVFACVKALRKGGIAHAEGSIRVGDKILQINGEEITADTEMEIQAMCASLLRQCQGEVVLTLSSDRADSYSDDLALTQDEDEVLLHSDDQLGALSDGPYEMKLVGRTTPRRIFGPSVTTTDEESDYDAADDLSAAIQHLGNNITRPSTAAAIQHLGNNITRPSTADSEMSADESATDESSFDFDLPDESQFLETSIRLTRYDMKSPLSDDTKHNSESDTDHVMSDEEMLNSTRLTTDAHTDGTDTEGSIKEFDTSSDWGTRSGRDGRYDSSAIPGATADPDWHREDMSPYRKSSAPSVDSAAIARQLQELSQRRLGGSHLALGADSTSEHQMQTKPTSSSITASASTERLRTPKYTPPNNRKTLSVAGTSADVGRRQEASRHDSLASKTSGGSDEEEDNEADAALEKALAIEVTMQWVQGLDLLTTPARGLYTDSSLDGVITKLLARIANDDTYEEFKQLKAFKPTDSCETGKLKENKTKNRFRNVLPYDQSRVKLNNEEDYINASHIERSMGRDCYTYIASQGPMPHTTDDFWEMILEQGVTLVVMVTQDVEGGKVKCHRYWPDSLHTPMIIDDVYEITLLKVFALKDFDVRHLEVRDLETDEQSKVIHMNYTKWPDHGMPESAIPLLQFIRVMHELDSGGPILVHCSAGIGRTGTLLTLDIILGCIERDFQFDIHEIVTDLRKQRAGMIQTKDQYLFCYTATLEALEYLHQISPTPRAAQLKGSVVNVKHKLSAEGGSKPEAMLSASSTPSSESLTKPLPTDTTAVESAAEMSVAASDSEGYTSVENNSRTSDVEQTKANVVAPYSSISLEQSVPSATTVTPLTQSEQSISVHSKLSTAAAAVTDTESSAAPFSHPVKAANVEEPQTFD